MGTNLKGVYSSLNDTNQILSHYLEQLIKEVKDIKIGLQELKKAVDKKNS